MIILQHRCSSFYLKYYLGQVTSFYRLYKLLERGNVAKGYHVVTVVAVTTMYFFYHVPGELSAGALSLPMERGLSAIEVREELLSTFLSLIERMIFLDFDIPGDLI